MFHPHLLCKVYDEIIVPHLDLYNTQSSITETNKKSGVRILYNSRALDSTQKTLWAYKTWTKIAYAKSAIRHKIGKDHIRARITDILANNRSYLTIEESYELYNFIYSQLTFEEKSASNSEECLRALLEGLECQNIEQLLTQTNPRIFFKIGEAVAQQAKGLPPI